MIRPNDFELLLVRHGDAEDDAPGGDAARALTEPGQAAIRRVGAALERLELTWSEAWTSPYLRAKQTSAPAIPVHYPMYRKSSFTPG